jgi:tetratricopeptide (TPR) repeat protein
MKLVPPVLIFCLSVSMVLAQGKYDTADIDSTTPEGQLLTQAGMEQDVDQRAALYLKFLQEFPQSPFTALAYAQLHPYYVNKQDYDKAMEMADKLLALDPARVDIAHSTLKAAEAKKDPQALIAWSVKTSDASKKAAAAPKPEDESAVAAWEQSVTYATQVGQYAEYSLYAAALQSTDPEAKLALIEAFAKQYPESQYLPQLKQQRFEVYRATNNREGMVAVAEEALKEDPDNEDMLAILADDAYQKKDTDKVVSLADRLVAALNGKAKPENMDEAAWENKKRTLLGIAHWMKGVTLSNKGQLADAEKSLLEALPLTEGNDVMKAETLFHLGLVNYKLGDRSGDSKRILAAVKYNQDCAAIKSPFQAPAARNIKAIKSQYSIR